VLDETIKLDSDSEKVTIDETELEVLSEHDSDTDTVIDVFNESVSEDEDDVLEDSEDVSEDEEIDLFSENDLVYPEEDLEIEEQESEIDLFSDDLSEVDLFSEGYDEFDEDVQEIDLAPAEIVEYPILGYFDGGSSLNRTPDTLVGFEDLYARYVRVLNSITGVNMVAKESSMGNTNALDFLLDGLNSLSYTPNKRFPDILHYAIQSLNLEKPEDFKGFSSLLDINIENVYTGTFTVGNSNYVVNKRRNPGCIVRDFPIFIDRKKPEPLRYWDDLSPTIQSRLEANMNLAISSYFGVRNSRVGNDRFNEERRGFLREKIYGDLIKQSEYFKILGELSKKVVVFFEKVFAENIFILSLYSTDNFGVNFSGNESRDIIDFAFEGIISFIKEDTELTGIEIVEDKLRRSCNLLKKLFCSDNAVAVTKSTVGLVRDYAELLCTFKYSFPTQDIFELFSTVIKTTRLICSVIKKHGRLEGVRFTEYHISRVENQLYSIYKLKDSLPEIYETLENLKKFVVCSDITIPEFSDSGVLDSLSYQAKCNSCGEWISVKSRPFTLGFLTQASVQRTAPIVFLPSVTMCSECKTLLFTGLRLTEQSTYAKENAPVEYAEALSSRQNAPIINKENSLTEIAQYSIYYPSFKVMERLLYGVRTARGAGKVDEAVNKKFVIEKTYYKRMGEAFRKLSNSYPVSGNLYYELVDYSIGSASDYDIIDSKLVMIPGTELPTYCGILTIQEKGSDDVEEIYVDSLVIDSDNKKLDLVSGDVNTVYDINSGTVEGYTEKKESLKENATILDILCRYDSSSDLHLYFLAKYISNVSKKDFSLLYDEVYQEVLQYIRVNPELLTKLQMYDVYSADILLSISDIKVTEENKKIWKALLYHIRVWIDDSVLVDSIQDMLSTSNEQSAEGISDSYADDASLVDLIGRVIEYLSYRKNLIADEKYSMIAELNPVNYVVSDILDTNIPQDVSDLCDIPCVKCFIDSVVYWNVVIKNLNAGYIALSGLSIGSKIMDMLYRANNPLQIVDELRTIYNIKSENLSRLCELKVICIPFYIKYVDVVLAICAFSSNNWDFFKVSKKDTNLYDASENLVYDVLVKAVYDTLNDLSAKTFEEFLALFDDVLKALQISWEDSKVFREIFVALNEDCARYMEDRTAILDNEQAVKIRKISYVFYSVLGCFYRVKSFTSGFALGFFLKTMNKEDTSFHESFYKVWKEIHYAMIPDSRLDINRFAIDVDRLKDLSSKEKIKSYSTSVTKTIFLMENHPLLDIAGISWSVEQFRESGAIPDITENYNINTKRVDVFGSLTVADFSRYVFLYDGSNTTGDDVRDNIVGEDGAHDMFIS
jgi:hypothetical protein